MREKGEEIYVAVGSNEKECQNFAGAISNMPSSFGDNYIITPLKNGGALRFKYEDIVHGKATGVRAIVAGNDQYYGSYGLSEQYFKEMQGKGVKIIVVDHVGGHEIFGKKVLSDGAFAYVPGRSLIRLEDALREALDLNTGTP